MPIGNFTFGKIASEAFLLFLFFKIIFMGSFLMMFFIIGNFLLII